MSEYRPAIEVADMTAAVHRVLVPNETLYLYGFIGRSAELPHIPMMWLGRELIAILPMTCLVERWCGDEPGYGRPWHIVWAPPPGIDTEWLHSHSDWAA